MLPAAKEVLMTETLKGGDLLSFNFSVKPLVGNRSRRQVATLVTFGYVYKKDQSDRPVSTKRSPLASFHLSSSLLGTGGMLSKHLWIKGEQWKKEAPAGIHT